MESRSPYGSGVDGGADEKRMRLRYVGACRVCGVELPAKVEAIYERTTKTVRCVSHDVHPAVEPAVVEVAESGTGGASARGEFERPQGKA